MTTIANNDSLATNFNVDPYYDDFDETKNLYRVLFRPGLAVQARELTQLQTTLQNQIDRFGSHIFKEGSIVSGCEINYDQLRFYVRVMDDYGSNAVSISSWNGKRVTGNTSGLQAVVVGTANGSIADFPATKTLIVKYLTGNSSGTSAQFKPGEILNSNNSLSANVYTLANSVGTGSSFSIGEGVIFAKDHFIRVDAQSLSLNAYTSNTSWRVGFQINESIVSSSDDSTLLDPAQGSYNFNAPGANRLKLEATLTKIPVSSTSQNNFVQLAEIKNGLVQQLADRPLYAQIRDYIAKRTYDESGDYIVNGYNIRLREHLSDGTNFGVYTSGEGGDSTKLVAAVEPGSAYVQGFDVRNLVTRNIAIDKGTDFESTETTIPTNYGNYITVNEVVGNWDIMTHDQVSLRSAAANTVSNTQYSTSSGAGAEIGKARVRAMEYSSGTIGAPDAQYKMYLYDIKMSSDSFSNVRGVYLNNASIADAHADVVLTSGNAVLSETSFNKALFTIPSSFVKTIRDTDSNVDTDFRFLKRFDVTIATDGTFSIATGASDEQYPYSIGALNATQKRSGFYLSLNGTANTANLTGTVSATASSNAIVGSGTAFTSQLNKGDIINVGNSGSYLVSGITNDTNLNIITNAGSSVTGASFFKEFKTGQTLDLAGVGGDGASRTVTVGSTTSASFDIQESLQSTVTGSVVVELSKVNGQEAAKTYNSGRYVQVRVSDSTNGATGPWNLGLSDVFQISEVRKKTGNTVFSTSSEGTDVTNDFSLDNGQRDNFYDHAKLKIKNNSSFTPANGDVYLVKLDYFTHDTSQGIGYFSVDSYPIDDTNTANTSAITTQEIPIFTSPTVGQAYDLRNVIDLRPRISDTATDTTSVGSASINPATSTTIDSPAAGLHFSPPNTDYDIKYDYYLNRIDYLALTKGGQLRVIKGKPAQTPYPPASPSDAMLVGRIDVAPYPSLSFDLAKTYNRRDLAATITPIRQERFTMRDIGVLKNRIDRLEYYTALSLLETDARDLTIADASGNDRFKNGIIVDNFTGHNIGNVYNPDYSVSIDPIEREMRPSFKLDNVELVYHSANSSGVTKTGDMITLPYTSEKVIDQPYATTTRLVSGISYQQDGFLELTPDNDYWTDTVTKPDLQVNFNNTADNWEALANAWGTQWNDWQTSWQGVDVQSQTSTPSHQRTWQSFLGGGAYDTFGVVQTTQTVTTTKQQIRDGLSARVIDQPEARTTNFGSRVVNVNIVPFMRSRVIQFTGRGLRANTTIYPFFDDTAVSSYVTPANSSFGNTANEGAVVKTDGNGNVYGFFRIPNDTTLRFRTGGRVFRISDSSTNSSKIGDVTTSAQATYTAQGVSQDQQNTIVSTREPQLVFDTVEEQRTLVDSKSSSDRSVQYTGQIDYGQE